MNKPTSMTSHPGTSALFIALFAVVVAQADEPHGIRAKWATQPELSTTNLAVGELVLNVSEPSDLRVGDGGTPGGQAVGAWVMDALREDPDFLHDIGGATADETKALLALSVGDPRPELRREIVQNAGDIYSNAAALTAVTNAFGQRISEFETVNLVYSPSTATTDTYYVPTNCPTRNLAIHLLVTVYTSTNVPCTVRLPANWDPGRPMTVTLYGSGHTNTRISYGIGNRQHMTMTGPNARECEYVWLPEAEQWEVHYRNVANGFDNPNAAGVKVTGAGRLANMPTTIGDWIEWRKQQPW